MSLDRETYPGLYNALATPDMALELDDVADDVAAEQETLTSSKVPASSGGGVMNGLSCLQETLKHVSKGISDSTESENKRFALFFFIDLCSPSPENLQANLELRHLLEGARPPSGWRDPVFSSAPSRSSLPHRGVDHGCVSLTFHFFFCLSHASRHQMCLRETQWDKQAIHR